MKRHRPAELFRKDLISGWKFFFTYCIIEVGNVILLAPSADILCIFSRKFSRHFLSLFPPPHLYVNVNFSPLVFAASPTNLSIALASNDEIFLPLHQL